MKNRLLKSLIFVLVITIMLCNGVFAGTGDLTKKCYSSFDDMWNNTTAGATGTDYFWHNGYEGWGVYKATWKKKLTTQSKIDEYEDAEENYDGETFLKENYPVTIELYDSLNGVKQIGGKWYVMENGSIVEGTNTSGYADKKTAQKEAEGNNEEEKEEPEEKEEDEDNEEVEEEDKLSKIKLPILEDGMDGTWHEATDVSSITNASSNDWVFITSDNDLIKNGFIVVKEVNSDKYNVSKFNKDGIWEGYLDKTGTLSKTSGNNKTLDEVIEIAKNKSKASTINLDTQEEKELEDNNGGGSGSGSGGSGGSGSGSGSSSGKKKSYKLEKVQSINPTYKLNDVEYLGNSNGLQMFGMCISKDYARVNEMTEWYNKDDNMVKAGDWFEKAKYTWNITKDLLNNAMSGKNYNYGNKNVFRYDTTTLKSMQGKITEVQQEKQESLLSTILLIAGVLLCIYGVLLILAFFLDTRGFGFMVRVGGFYDMLTIGKYRIDESSMVWNDELSNAYGYKTVTLKVLFKMVLTVWVIGGMLMIPPIREYVIYLVQTVIDWVAKIVGFTKEDL